MTPPTIEVRELTKTFGAFTAVDHISFDVAKGEIFGFLGPNGAGKSTTIRMLCGILQPTSGTGRVGGFDIGREPDAVKRIIGYMSQKFTLYGDLTVSENIDFHGGIRRLRPAVLAERKRWVLRMAGLVGRERSLTRDLSGGWKQRLALGCSILHHPEILFLDEPTASVDPASRRDFWDLIYALAEEGTTVFVTSHYMDEVERCHRIAIIFAGRIAAIGTPRELKLRYIGRDDAPLEDVFVAAVEAGRAGA
jgi:ABC-2 type transport system ATP-binding protein